MTKDRESHIFTAGNIELSLELFILSLGRDDSKYEMTRGKN